MSCSGLVVPGMMFFTTFPTARHETERENQERIPVPIVVRDHCPGESTGIHNRRISQASTGERATECYF